VADPLLAGACDLLLDKPGHATFGVHPGSLSEQSVVCNV
jgi:hypothetical protein